MVRRVVRNTLIFWFLVLLMICISPAVVSAKGEMRYSIVAQSAVVGAEQVDSILNDAVSGDGLTLPAAIQSAIDANPKFLSQKHGYSSSHQAYLRSYGALLPQLDFVAKGGYLIIRNDTTSAIYDDKQGEVWSNDMRMVLSQLIYDGGLTSSKVDADKFYSQSNKEELFNTAEDVGLTATQYFMEVIRNRALIELCERNIAEHANILELTRVRLSSGGGTQVDVSQAEASLEEARSRLVQARQGLEDAEAGYAKLFGDKAGKLAMPDRPVGAIPQDVEAAIALAMDNNRALKAAHLAIMQKDREAESAEGLMLPQLYAKLSGGRSDNTGGYESNYHDVSAMLQVNFNLYNGGSDAAAIREAKSKKLKALQDAEEVRRKVEEDVKTAYSFHKVTGNLLPILSNLTNENAKIVVSYADQFRMGKRTLLDLVSAQKSLFSSQQVYLNAMTAHTFSYYRICMPISALMATLNVTIDVPEMD
ncbi:MAG: TolC family outer membrane protein [Desulfomicrobium sp.]|nr:TolC family outer membrane protein [Pseudomonadota bacterium]MBV1713098.1 TolC family outer membrane protein [Desulfomicrobium sp.]MBU4572438.1 TolC family outer membrane protein [Pseudomonadota bacterium]MBU4593753.1 TolC family outer membrane protein [Pseudomonadota bacterium]MBV1719843.1 TolC family outer membrane protein [Desulfomicrobium sp.]